MNQQKLGLITLLATEDEEVDIFEWCGLAIKSKQESTKELETLKIKSNEKDNEIRTLQETLTELITVKNAQEEGLIQKFSILLNEKKLKIRDQQRLLASANVNLGKLEEVERHCTPARASPPGPSRTAKRKARAVVREDSDESDDGFERMDVDTVGQPHDSDNEDRRTEDEQSTADEDSEDDGPPIQVSTRSNASNAEASESPTTAQPEDIGAPPPKRDLPFAKKSDARSPKPAAAPAASETESDDDDDEL